MGTKKFRFWHDVFPHVTRRTTVVLENKFVGQTWGVDILPWIYESPKHHAELAQAVASTSPVQYEPTHLMRTIAQRHERLLEIDIEPIYVFPGAVNPLRLQRPRDRQRLAYFSHYHSKYQQSNGSENNSPGRQSARSRSLDHEKFSSHLVQCERGTDPQLLPFLAQWMRSENMRVVGAPYEAAWQLVELERSGMTQGTFGHDAALVWAGAQQLLVQPVFKHPMSANLFHASRDVPKARNAKRQRFFYESRQDYLPEAAACYGTAYNERLAGDSVGTILQQRFRKWAIAIEDDDANGDVQYWQHKMGKSEEFALQMRRVANQFRYGPVVRPRDSVASAASIEPLNPLPDGITWEECLGFDPMNGLAGLEGEEEYGQAMRWDGRMFWNDSLIETPWYVGLSPVLQKDARDGQSVITEEDVKEAVKEKNTRVIEDHKPILGW